METLTLAECMNIYGGCYIYSSSTSLTSVFVVSSQFRELFVDFRRIVQRNEYNGEDSD